MRYWIGSLGHEGNRASRLTLLRQGRGALYLGERLCFTAEWHWFTWRWFHVGLEVGGWGDHDILLSLCPCLFALYLGVEGLPQWLRRRLPDKERNCSIAFHNGSLWLNPWTFADEWHSRNPWWKRGLTLHIDDWLRGKLRYSVSALEERDVLIPMPEGAYPARAVLQEATWSRARWFPHSLLRVTITIDGERYIPFEGKGENSWDCGEDGIRSQTAPAKTIEEGVGNLVASVLETRARRSGSWQHRNLLPVLAPRETEEDA